MHFSLSKNILQILFLLIFSMEKRHETPDEWLNWARDARFKKMTFDTVPLGRNSVIIVAAVMNW